MLFTTLFKLQLQVLVAGFYHIAMASISHPGTIRGCEDATLITRSTHPFNGADIAHSTYHCSPGNRVRQEYPYQSDNDTVAQNTCESPCNIQCNHKEGILPPIYDDCMIILNSVLLLPYTDSDDIHETFVLNGNDMRVLSYETCEVFLENHGTVPLQFCYSTLVGHVLEAESSCFPPVQPFYPEGVCKSADSSWRVGVAHS